MLRRGLRGMGILNLKNQKKKENLTESNRGVTARPVAKGKQDEIEKNINNCNYRMFFISSRSVDWETSGVTSSETHNTMFHLNRKPQLQSLLYRILRLQYLGTECIRNQHQYKGKRDKYYKMDKIVPMVCTTHQFQSTPTVCRLNRE